MTSTRGGPSSAVTLVAVAGVAVLAQVLVPAPDAAALGLYTLLFVGSGGVAHALHQWNPAKPNACPVKNFPDATPA